MVGSAHTNNVLKNTAPALVLPFYLYAALSLLAGTLLLFFSAGSFTATHLHPHVLAITHIMALGWGTMMILGASHQLVPVLIENGLYSTILAYAAFVVAAVGIPLLVYGFYFFNMGWPAMWGGGLVLIAILCYVINLAMSIGHSHNKNVHAWFILAASVWLLITAGLGMLLVYNFTYQFLPTHSFSYLPLHAHTGIVGWFLLLVTGVGSRLIPMFLISKYTNNKLLWGVFILINAGLLYFAGAFVFLPGRPNFVLPMMMILVAIILFAWYCYKSYTHRIRKQVDGQMKTSLLSVGMMLLPFIFLMGIAGWLLIDNLAERLVLLYGFIIFFGWITAIIFGMTFKTLPFIVWNKLYHQQAGIGKTPNPKDLFSNTIFIMMLLAYLIGFILFIAGVVIASTALLTIAAAILLLAAVLYNWNVIKILLHKPLLP